MRATLSPGPGTLVPIEDCYIQIPQLSNQKIIMDNLPDISDSKSANYSSESSIGRSSNFVNYSHSESRTISWTCHFFYQKASDEERIISTLRLLEACTYPMTITTGGAPYAPPPICHIKCGRLLSENHLCAILKSYNVKFDTSIPWNSNSKLPYKLDVDLQFEVVKNQSTLPGAETIMKFGE